MPETSSLILARYSASMQPDPPALPQITDEDLASSKAAVRALVVARLEQLWRPISDHLKKVSDFPPDPRLLEIGLRITKDLSLMYQLQRPVKEPEEEETEEIGGGVDRRALVEQTLVELEAKRRAAES